MDSYLDTFPVLADLSERMRAYEEDENEEEWSAEENFVFDFLVFVLTHANMQEMYEEWVGSVYG